MQRPTRELFKRLKEYGDECMYVFGSLLGCLNSLAEVCVGKSNSDAAETVMLYGAFVEGNRIERTAGLGRKC